MFRTRTRESYYAYRKVTEVPEGFVRWRNLFPDHIHQIMDPTLLRKALELGHVVETVKHASTRRLYSKVKNEEVYANVMFESKAYLAAQALAQ